MRRPRSEECFSGLGLGGRGGGGGGGICNQKFHSSSCFNSGCRFCVI